MIGRAATGRPWLAGAIAIALETGEPLSPPSVHRQRDGAIAHYFDTLNIYGEPLGIRMARKHLAAYVEHAPYGIDWETRRAIRGAICQTTSPDRVAAMLTAVFDGDFDAAIRAAA